MTGAVRRVLPAAGTRSVSTLIDGEPVPGRLLGLFRTAAYLQLPNGEVIAVLTRDAVRLPCGLVLAQSSRDDPLDRLDGPVLVGASQVSIGDLTVRLVRTRDAMVSTGLSPHPEAVAGIRSQLDQASFEEHDPHIIDALAQYQDSEAPAQQIADALVGAGSGLTPSGDDIVAGFLVACRAVGLPYRILARVAIARATGHTTALSAALLRCAGRGETIPQLTHLLRSLSSPIRSAQVAGQTLMQVLAIGHTSGTAMATGVLAACHSRLRQA